MNDGDRPNPDALLAAIQSEAARETRGHLKVFLGMCPGVGKTYAMLEAAQRELKAGHDIVVGYVETHGRTETYSLLAGLSIMSRKEVEYRAMTLHEMDIDAILARNPQLVLVDELAHTNALGSRHPKRWQDVKELLDAGIDVFTTVNVQHIESRADTVRQITRTEIRETVPDSVLDEAMIELVDLPPAELLQRLKEGKVYLAERATTAAQSFFREANLTALRELALRLVADHVSEDTQEFHRAQTGSDAWKTGHRLLVAVSSSPASASLVRWTRRLADELHAAWGAVYVETPRSLSLDDQARLAKHLALARELGAEIISTTDDDVVRGILRIAREQNTTQIVVGKPASWRTLDLLRGGSMLNRLIRDSGQIDIHAVRADGENISGQPIHAPHFKTSDAHGFVLAVIITAIATGVNLVLQRWIGYQSLSLVYLFAVVGLGMFVGRWPTLVAAALTALSWNFFFTAPRHSFRINNAADAMMFTTYFVVALAIGQLAARLREQQAAERKREQRATALYMLTRELAEAPDLAQLLAVVIRQVGEAFRADVALSLPEESDTAPTTPYFASTWSLPDKEQSVAAWAFQHRQPAGRDTDTLASSEGLHLPLVAGERVTGVLSLCFRDSSTLPPAQRDLLDAFVRQVALVLDRQRLRDEEHEAKLVAESERLGKTLLNSVSHELRTPLAAICTVAGGLRASGSLNPAQESLSGELAEAAGRLNRLVQNLLDLSRLEAGHLQPDFDWHDLRDLLEDAQKTLGRALERHELKINLPPNLPPVKLDGTLTEQILVNLLGNAAMHTPAGTTIEVHAKLNSGQLILEVVDNGPGLPPGDPAKLFNRFQRGPSARAGGTGIGLSLVKGFAEAQGGTVSAANRSGGGAVFTVKLPSTAMPPVPEEKE